MNRRGAALFTALGSLMSACVGTPFPQNAGSGQFIAAPQAQRYSLPMPSPAPTSASSQAAAYWASMAARAPASSPLNNPQLKQYWSTCTRSSLPC